MTAPPRYLSPFVRTRTRLSLTLGLVLAALTASLLPWWQPDDTPPARADGTTGTTDATRASTGPRDEATATAEAARTGKQVLVDTATTATALTWALPDGQFKTRITATPTRVKNAAGAWVPVDNKLRRTAKAPRGLGVAPRNPVVPVRFASGTAQKARADRSFARAETPGETVLAEVELDGHTVAYTWPGALPEPVLDGPRALYSEVLPDVDLLLVAREEGGMAQVLIVKTPEAARQEALKTVRYRLRSDTAVFRQDRKASRVRVLDKAGKEVGSIPTPFAWDSSGRDPELRPGTPNRTSTTTPAEVLKLSGLTGVEPGANSAPLPITLDGENTHDARLGLGFAATGLAAREDVTYPLFVDPPLNPGWDAWTVAYKPYPSTSFFNGTNFSSGTSEARVGHESDTGGTARSFWRMDWYSSIKGAEITSATFKVLNTHSWSCTSREFQIWRTGPISSGTTWNAQPSWSDELQRKSFAHGWSSSCPNDYEAFNVKDAAQYATNNGHSTLTLGMRASSESDTQTWRKFKATDASIEAVYNRPPSEPTKGSSKPGGACTPGPGAGVTVGKTNITLSVTAKDPDNNMSKVRFRFWKTGSTVPAGTYVTIGASGGTSSLTIPVTDARLKDITTTTTFSWDAMGQDLAGVTSSNYPPGTEPCRITVDPSGPSQPEVTSDVFLEATPSGTTWATVKFGTIGPITFESPGAVRFQYAWGGVAPKSVNADANGIATVPDLQPFNAGPNTLQVYAYDNLGNPSVRTDYTTYVPPKENADTPGDTGGDGTPDLLVIDAAGALRTYPGQKPDGELYGQLTSSYGRNADGTTLLNPPGHWYDAASTLGNKAALIAHYQDTYPGDGTTDLFARTPDGGFWLYPGDGYGSFDVTQRMKIRLPSNAPAPSTWTQLKALGDVTGDKLPDLVLRTAAGFWVLSGYTGGSVQTATMMNPDAWSRRDIVNLADMNKDGVADLLWRNLDNGNLYLRRGKPGTVTGSVDLNSLMLGSNAVNGDESFGTTWTEANVNAAIGIPDINGDGIPDIWARFASDGHMSVYHPATNWANGPVKTVIGSGWNEKLAFG
ncbi:DNRLRE domain-containing protein [Streptomyces turgidiscabies]|uniref:FG-GAP repeat protein n=1 Tax=Streptomyces turgidiscabies (strain Car8) TaxID=698760 RepID=L7FCW4_STRT8|nr:MULTISPECIES: DNRLRE domain-containing protein [Streptomyces]ELP68994.1 FG-GAP repeat protein [Streptomyces turgidiscabies Car8]MDX3494351.1 DNRLRE domain-containing protein [Streptomyces turgidiscabies]GAQ74629.1 FG-GAP repeat protein [Streptomyces turgidiscabies]